MKRLAIYPLFLLIFFCSGKGHAQKQDTLYESVPRPFIYGYFGGGVPTGTFTMNGGLSYIHTNNWGLSIGYQLYDKVASELPADYDPGLNLFLWGKPHDNIESFYLHGIREFKTKSVFFRFGIEAGPSLIFFYSNHFTYTGYNGWFSSNYLVTYTKTVNMGLSFKARSDIAFSRGMGLQIAFVANMNGDVPYLGGEAYLTIGRLRERTIKENQRRGRY